MPRTGLALVLVSLLGLTVPSPGSAAEPVPFTGWSITLPTATLDGGSEQITATILKPEGNGPFPAITILHDCSGLGARASGSPSRWANLLAGQGYAIIMPDSFAPRGFPEGVCTAPADTPRERLRSLSPRQQSFDAYAALAWLRAQPFVDGSHIGVLGNSHGGSATLGAMVQPPSPTGFLAEAKKNGFVAGIALYPGCDGRYGEWSVKRQLGDHGPAVAYIGTYKPIAPLLILVGEKDDWTPAKPCEALTERAVQAGFPVELKVYPGVQHAFDSSHPVRFVPARRNINAPEGRGATTGGNAQAWADSIRQVTAFFARTLKPAQ